MSNESFQNLTPFSTVETDPGRRSSEKINREHLEYVRPIGRGGMGEISLYRTNNERYPHKVAVKTLFRKSVSEREKERLEKEMEILGSLDHENIIRIYGVTDTDFGFGIVLEYFPNGSYAEFFDEFWRKVHKTLKKEKILGPLKTRLLAEVVEAMTYLHGLRPKKLLHLDLKGDNVLLNNGLHAKVCDFGLSRMSTLTSIRRRTTVHGGRASGTPGYIAPERLKDIRCKPTTKCDVYSFGILAFTILSDSPPFPDHLYDDLAWFEHNITKKNLRPEVKTIPKVYSEKEIKILEDSWCSDPKKRPTFLQLKVKMEEIKDETSTFQEDAETAVKKLFTWFGDEGVAVNLESSQMQIASDSTSSRRIEDQRSKKVRAASLTVGISEPRKKTTLQEGNAGRSFDQSTSTNSQRSYDNSVIGSSGQRPIHSCDLAPNGRRSTSNSSQEQSNTTPKALASGAYLAADSTSYQPTPDNPPLCDSSGHHPRGLFNLPRPETIGGISENRPYQEDNGDSDNEKQPLLDNRPAEGMGSPSLCSWRKGFLSIGIFVVFGIAAAVTVHYVVHTSAPKQGSCPKLKPPSNGSMTCNKQTSKTNTKCSFTCNKGYGIVGEKIISCSGERWDGKEPFCAPTCPDLLPVSNCNVKCTNGTFVKSTCSFTCSNGHEIQGNTTITCLASSKLSNSEPNCTCPSCYSGDNCEYSIRWADVQKVLVNMEPYKTITVSYGGHSFTCTTELHSALAKWSGICTDQNSRTTTKCANYVSSSTAARHAAAELGRSMISAKQYPMPCDPSVMETGC